MNHRKALPPLVCALALGCNDAAPLDPSGTGSTSTGASSSSGAGESSSSTAPASSEGSGEAESSVDDTSSSEGSADTTAADTSGSESSTGEPLPADPISNTPNATIDPVQSDGGIRILSSNLRQHPSAGIYFQEWFAEVENVGTDTYCFINVAVTMTDANAVEQGSFYAYADTPPYDDVEGADLSTSCLAPGDRGAMYSNAFVEVPAAIDDIVAITLEWDDGVLTPAAVPHPATPTLVSANVFESWIEGELRADAGPIYNIVVHFFVRDESGLIVDRVDANHLDPLFDGGSWDFETSAAEGSIDSYLYFVQFIPGVG